MRVLAERAKRIHEIRFLRFALVGTGGFLVNWVVLYLSIHLAHLDKYTSWYPAFFVAVTFTWWGNRLLTFRDRAERHRLGREWLIFFVANCPGAVANKLVYNVFITSGPSPFNEPMLALVPAVLVGLALNFTLSTIFVFRKQS
jgi:putative flippase GtrA